jgi:hypothetical protein
VSLLSECLNYSTYYSSLYKGKIDYAMLPYKDGLLVLEDLGLGLLQGLLGLVGVFETLAAEAKSGHLPDHQVHDGYDAVLYWRMAIKIYLRYSSAKFGKELIDLVPFLWLLDTTQDLRRPLVALPSKGRHTWLLASTTVLANLPLRQIHDIDVFIWRLSDDLLLHLLQLIPLHFKTLKEFLILRGIV